MAENKLAVKTVIGVLQQPMVVARFKEVLGQRAPKFVSSLISAVHMTPALQKCDATSVMSAGMIAASIDIPINQSLGFAYIIPYGNLAQFQLGAKGFIQLAERTGQYQTINVSSVYADEIESWNPITGVLKLTDMKKWKLRGKENSEDIVGYAAYFKMTNGFEKWHYMTVKQLIVHGKKYSKSYETGQWKKEGKSLKDASKVFCSVSHTFTDLETKKINKSEFVVNFDNLNSLAKKSGKELIKEDGTSIPVKASISKGIITFA